MVARIKLKNNIIEVEGKAYSATQMVFKGVFTGRLLLSREKVEGFLDASGEVGVFIEDEWVFVEGGFNPGSLVKSISIHETPGSLLVLAGGRRLKSSEALLELDNARVVVNLTIHPLNLTAALENPSLEVSRKAFTTVIKIKSL